MLHTHTATYKLPCKTPTLPPIKCLAKLAQIAELMLHTHTATYKMPCKACTDAFISSSRKQIQKILPIPRTQKVQISGPNMSSISSMSSTFQTLVEPQVRSSCRFVVPLLRVCCFLLAFDLLAPSTSMSAMLGLHILESSCKGLVQAWVPACSYARRA